MNYLEDLISDFSVFHRIDNIYEMEAVEFQRKAFRIAAYKGVMYQRLLNKEDEQKSSNPSNNKEIEATRESFEVNGLGDLFDFN